MAASSRARSSSRPVVPNSSSFQRSVSPTGRFSAVDRSSGFAVRSASPTRVNLYGSPSARSVSLSIDRAVKKPIAAPAPGRRRTCTCSPTTHPGSFRCGLHKRHQSQSPSIASYPSNRLNARRSAMTNSLVRIGTVEGDLVKRALAALIRPSSHQQRRRGEFQPRLSRLSVMCKADE